MELMSAQSHSTWQLGTKYVTLNDQTGYTVQTAAETTTQIDMDSSIDANHTETPRYTTNERRRLHRPAEQKGQRTPQLCDKTISMRWASCAGAVVGPSDRNHAICPTVPHWSLLELWAGQSLPSGYSVAKRTRIYKR